MKNVSFLYCNALIYFSDLVHCEIVPLSRHTFTNNYFSTYLLVTFILASKKFHTFWFTRLISYFNVSYSGFSPLYELLLKLATT